MGPITRIAFGAALAFLLTGCQFLGRRLEAAGYFSAASAGYAGRFRIAFGRWPANVNELEEFICMPGRAVGLGLAHLSCDGVVDWPYRTVLTPEGNHLRLKYYEKATGRLICNMQLKAPPDGADLDTFPRVIIKSTIFTCAESGFGRRVPGSTEVDID